MKKRKIFIIISTIILFIIILISLCFIFPYIEFKLIGNKTITLNYGEKYEEQGTIAKINRLLDYSKNIKIDNSKLDTSKIGTYTIYYKLDWFFYKKLTLTRDIKIIDKESPSIELKGDNPLSIAYGSTYNDPGYIISDNYDTEDNIKVNITYDKEINTKQSGTYKVNYEVIDGSGNKNTITRTVTVKEKPRIYTENGITYVDGILIVNKKYSLPSTYNPGNNSEASYWLQVLRSDAEKNGHYLYLCSAFRSYWDQDYIYWNYVSTYGQELTDTFSARPGHSEHQTGLAFDVGYIDDDFGNWPSGIWLAENAHKYGFIIRYPKGKQHITGYKYEPWHIRYLGKDLATKVYNSGLTLEEYLGI